MGLVSKMSVKQMLQQRHDEFRDDTEQGRFQRRRLLEIIEEVDKLGLVACHLSASECAEALSKVNARVEELAAEPEEDVYQIDGHASVRYTQNPDTAKAILAEEMARVVDSIDSGWNEESVSIRTIEVKSSDLKLYQLEP